MKKRLIVLLVFLLAVTSCNSASEVNKELKKPDIENATKRAEVGNVFYEDEQIEGIYIPTVGYFLFDSNDEKVIDSFNISSEYLNDNMAEPAMSEDKENILLELINPNDGNTNGYLAYNLKSKKLNKIEKENYKPIKVKKEWEDNIVAEDDSFELSKIKLTPDSVQKTFYPFKDLNTK